MKLLPYRVFLLLLYPTCTFIKQGKGMERTVYIPDLARSLKARAHRVRKALKYLEQAGLVEGFEEDRDRWTATLKLKDLKNA